MEHTRMKDFLKQLQLAFVSVNSSVLGVKEVDPILLPYSQHHGVLAVNLFKDVILSAMLLIRIFIEINLTSA